MHWFQSFPHPVPDGRSYVHWDNSVVQRVAVDGGDYGEAIRRMWKEAGGGFWMLEWDIAIGLDDMKALEAAARWKPDAIHVCSYALHWRNKPKAYEAVQWNAPVVVQEKEGPEVIHSTKSIMNCDYPGLGVIWFPAWLCAIFDQEDFWPNMRYPDADSTFWRKVGQANMHIVRDVQPVHLHW